VETLRCPRIGQHLREICPPGTGNEGEAGVRNHYLHRQRGLCRGHVEKGKVLRAIFQYYFVNLRYNNKVVYRGTNILYINID
jgi:hypothetical protein